MLRRLQRRHHFAHAFVDAAQFLQALDHRVQLRRDALRVFVQRRVGGAGRLLQTHHVAQHAALVFKLRVFAQLRIHRFDFVALKTPQVGLAQLFLRGAVELGQFLRCRAPARVERRDLRQLLGRVREPVQHFPLHAPGKQLLLIVLAMDIAQAPRQFLEQRRRHRTPAREGPRLAVGQDLALDDQLAVFRFHALRKRLARPLRRFPRSAPAPRRCAPSPPPPARPAAAPAHPPRSTCRFRSPPSADSARDESAPAPFPPRRSFRRLAQAAWASTEL